MKGRWHRDDPAGHHVPVEMRFVDMFMTALGALIFIIVLLIFLLPQTAQQSQSAQKSQSPSSEKKYDREVLKRWLSVMLVMEQCKKTQPYAYIRWDVDLFNVETGKPAGRMEPFSAARFTRHQLFGHNSMRFVRQLGSMVESKLKEAEKAQPIEGPATEVVVYNGAMGGSGPADVYLSLVSPQLSDDSECRIWPVVFGSSRVFENLPVISLARGHPYAWLAHVELEQDGSVKVSDPKIVEHQRFSDDQSRRLCEEHKICDTQDAYLMQRKPPGQKTVTGTGGSMEWVTGMMFDRRGRIYKTNTSQEDCEKACADDPECVAVEYTELGGRYCFVHSEMGEELPASMWMTGTKRSDKGDTSVRRLSWKRDHFVPDGSKPARKKEKLSKEECAKACAERKSCVAAEYYKPGYECRLFDNMPKMLEAGRSNSPRDVAVKGDEAPKDDKRDNAKDDEDRADDSFSHYDNRDVMNHDLTTIENVEQEICEKSCAEKKECVGYSYDKWNRWCFLKNGADQFRLEPNTISGLRASVKEPKRIGVKPKLDRYPKKAFPYGGQDSEQARSLEECEERCMGDEKCVALTYFRKSKLCRVMETTGAYFDDPDADSSVKRQEPKDAN